MNSVKVDAAGTSLVGFFFLLIWAFVIWIGGHKIIDNEFVEVIIIGVPYLTDGGITNMTKTVMSFIKLFKSHMPNILLFEQDETKRFPPGSLSCQLAYFAIFVKTHMFCLL